MKRLNPEDWARFWQRPSITSFGDMFPDNYDGSILEFWNRQLDGEFDQLVDIACGNGALSWLSNEILNSGPRKTRITGVDSADISPFKALGKQKGDFPEIRFIGNTPVENLPFEDQSVDLAISQYGVEYSNLDETIPEIARVLIPTGRMCFILHDKESALIKGAINHLDDYKTVLNDIAIHDLAFKLDDLCRRIESPAMRRQSNEHQELVRRISLSADRIRTLISDYQTRTPIHLYVERLNQTMELAHQNKNIDRKAMISFAREALESHIVRIDDLEAAALSAEDRRHLVFLVESENFKIIEEGTLLFNNNDNIGSILVAQR